MIPLLMRPKSISEISHADHNYEFTFNSNNSMFLGGVCQSDVLEVVHKFKTEKSTHDNTIDMSLIKEVMDCVLKPFTDRWKKSFQTHVFPDRMKMTKVVPIYKNGDKHLIKLQICVFAASLFRNTPKMVCK